MASVVGLHGNVSLMHTRGEGSCQESGLCRNAGCPVKPVFMFIRVEASEKLPAASMVVKPSRFHTQPVYVCLQSPSSLMHVLFLPVIV